MRASTTQKKTECDIEQKAESERDRIAREIADEINSKTDTDAFEYAAGIFIRADGSYGRTALQRGRRCSNDVNIPYTESQIGNGGRIVGDVHNHPSSGTCSQTVSGTNGPSRGDWRDVQSNYIDTGFSSREEFALFFVDENGDLSEFDETSWGRRRVREENKQDANGTCE